MEISRLTFRKETKEKMTKQLSPVEKGKILYKKLQELEDNGTLSKAENRYEVAKLAGYPEERISAGYSWISRLIKAGRVTETVRGFAPNGMPISEYHLVSKPTKAEVSTVSTTETETVIRPETTNSDVIKVEITRGGVTVKIEFTDSKLVSELIATMLKGE